MTLIETLVVIAILGVVIAPLTNAVRNMMRFITQGFFEWRASAAGRPMDIALEMDLNEAVRLDGATNDMLAFTMDSNRMPKYDPGGDPDNDGLPNALDPDDDNDMDSWPAPADWQMTGNDLDDDDEDGDGKVDLRVRYRYSGGVLTRGVSVNGGGWTTHEIAKGLKEFNFSYFGSTNRTVGPDLDIGMDGVANTGDSGEGDGMVTADEIDMAAGDANGLLDVRSEYSEVKVVEVSADFDINGDGKNDFRVEKAICPPLWGFRRDWP